MKGYVFIILIALFSVRAGICLPPVSGNTGLIGAEQQKGDKKKGKKGDTGQAPVNPGNAGLLIDAKKEALTGNLKNATDLFRQYTHRYPDDPVGFYELARLEADQKNYFEARTLCETAFSLDPGNKWYALFMAELYQFTSQPRDALAVYRKLLSRDPGNLDYLYQIAALYLQTEDYQEAIKTYNKIEENAGIQEEISLQKKAIYLHLNDLKAAEREIQKLAASNPSDTRYLSILAEFYIANKMMDQALECYLKIAQMEPDNPYIHMSLADYYRKTGNKEQAFEELKLGFANPNLDIDTKVNILLSFYTVNQIYNDLKEQAFILSRILVETHPKDPKAYSIYGDLLVQDKKFTEAREIFGKVIALDSSRYAVWEQYLQIDLQLSEYEDLLRACRKASELFPEQPLPFLFEGLAYIQLKNNEKALKSFAAGANLVADNNQLLAQFYMYQGDALHAMKRDTEAFQAYERSLKLDPDNSYVLNNYAYYLSLKDQDLEKAETMAKKAVTMEPENGSFQDTYGWVLFKMGKYKDAAGWILKAVENTEAPSAEVLEHYGDVLFHLGEKDSAVDYWRKAKEKGAVSGLLEKKIAEQKYYPE